MGNLQQMIESIVAEIDSMTMADKVDALNTIRAALHDASPFKDEPVDLVRWVPASEVYGNDYNPNSVAPPEMRLLELSITEDGYTQPIVAHSHDGAYEVVDGFHRHRVGKESEPVRERLHGYLPITTIRVDRTGKADRIAATIRHNRARGEHAIVHMAEIVRGLYLVGWTDEKIQKHLGMQADEVIRLKQCTGLAALFANRDFSQAWEPEGQR